MKLTTKNLSIKRLKYLAGALTAVLGFELIAPGAFSWEVVRTGSEVALGYWLLATFRDWQDPEVPNK